MAIGAAAPWMLVGLAREPGFAASRRFVTGTCWDPGSHRRRHRRGRCAAAISQRDRCDPDGRDDPSPARVDPWLLCAGVHHPARDRAGAGAPRGVGGALAMKSRGRAATSCARKSPGDAQRHTSRRPKAFQTIDEARAHGSTSREARQTPCTSRGPARHDAPCAPIRTSSINPLIVRCWLLHELSALARVMFENPAAAPGRGPARARDSSIESQLVDNLNASSAISARSRWLSGMVQHLCCFFEGEAANEPQLDDLAHPRIERRLQRMIRSLLAHVALCQTMELVIDERHESVEGRTVALAPGLEELSGSVGGIRRHDSLSG